ncbi:hypothetical protein MPNT_10440 [Candidatus Methylacidithermus pantelleriae]|uniref:Uncharacterized protein n=1 Tax=Candidatus Methylacidithermus pantelleriae TaxID=2744239 RepID=A0A8J2BR59_9BACT|nr:hypothetical protein MPNT_10440 [Candidatus Methylacidithermus pantelleriae]
MGQKPRFTDGLKPAKGLGDLFVEAFRDPLGLGGGRCEPLGHEKDPDGIEESGPSGPTKDKRKRLPGSFWAREKAPFQSWRAAHND